MEKREYPKTTAELKIGTVFVEHWCNFVSFYKLLKTTPKGVVIQELDFKTSADPDGDITWRVATPTDKFYQCSRPTRKQIHPCSNGEGFWVEGLNGGSLQIYDGNPCPVYWG